MIVAISVVLSGLSFGVRGNSPANWWGKCKAEFEDTGGYPIRGDVRFLNRYPAELAIYPRDDDILNRALMAAGLDEKIREWRVQGYDQPDAMLLRYHKQDGRLPEFLGISIAMSRTKLIHFESIAREHFGSRRINLSIISSFAGFREPDFDNPDLPTREQFLGGRHHFATTDLNVTLHPIDERPLS